MIIISSYFNCPGLSNRFNPQAAQIKSIRLTLKISQQRKQLLPQASIHDEPLEGEGGEKVIFTSVTLFLLLTLSLFPALTPSPCLNLLPPSPTTSITTTYFLCFLLNLPVLKNPPTHTHTHTHKPPVCSSVSVAVLPSSQHVIQNARCRTHLFSFLLGGRLRCAASLRHAEED